MNKISMILSAILTLALVVIIAPNIFAMNKGKVLRNIALWLAIFAGLALIYQNFGPGSKNQLFTMPGVSQEDAPPAVAPSTKTNDNAPADDHGFTPPKEE